MDNIMKELDHALQAMTQSKTVEEKETYSRIVKNISVFWACFLMP
jgi:hypothetical protein